MMYPKKTPKQAKEEQEAKKLINQQQREQLKSMVGQRLHAKYPTKDAESVQGKVEEFFKGNQPLTAETLKKLDQNVQANTKDAQYIDRDDISVKSGVSKMSGATDFVSVRGDDESGFKKENKVIDLMLATKKDKTGKKYKNEEEEWADIYEHNLKVYKAEADLEDERKKFAKTKYKGELDEQVDQKVVKKREEVDEKQIDYNDVMKRVKKLENQEKKKTEVAKAKMMYEKEMRDKQIKENKKQKRQEEKEEKQLDAYIINRIQEEQREDERVARKRKQEEYEGFRKIFQENEEKRKQQAEEQEKERQEENRLVEEQNRLISEREKARDDAAKAKDKRIREQIESGKNLLGKPSDERERRQDMKVQKWADKKEQEEEEEEMRQQHLILQRNLENKAYLDKQTAEKQIRKKEEKRDRDEQAGIWKNSNEQYEEWEKKKAEVRKNNMKEYAEVLKKQMNEKFEERRVTDKLFDVRATQYEKKNQQQQQQTKT